MHRLPVLKSVYLCAATLFALLTVVGSATPAAAHASLVSTAPADREVLDAAPSLLSLTFSEPVGLELAGIRLVGPDGGTLPTGRPEHPDGKPRSIAVRVAELPDEGMYTVAWHAVSADSHPVQGAFTFSLGQPAAQGGQAAAAPVHPDGRAAAMERDGWTVALHHTARWASFAGFALLLGTAFFVAFCRPGGNCRQAVRRLMLTGWCVLFLATALGLVLYGPYVGGAPLSAAADPQLVAAALDTRMGGMLVVRMAVLVLVAVALGVYFRRAGDWGRNPGAGTGSRAEPAGEIRGLRAGAVLVAGCGLSLTWSLASHSATGTLVPLAVAADAIHLTAMGVWIGGLVVLGAVLPRSPGAPDLEPVLSRFSRTAQTCVVLLIATGIFQAWRQVGTAPALFGTDYGRVLVAKVCLVAVLVVLGAVARGRVRRHYGVAASSHPGTRKQPGKRPAGRPVLRLTRLVLVETLIAVVLLGFSAVLVNTDPAMVEQAARAGETRRSGERPATTGPAPAPTGAVPFSKAVPFDAGGAQGKGVLAVVVDPSTTGVNQVHLSVLGPSGLPKDVPEVTAEFTLEKPEIGPISAPLTYAGPGHYISSATALPLRGTWELSVTLRLTDIDRTVVRMPVDVR